MLKYRRLSFSNDMIPNEYTAVYEMCVSHEEEGTELFLRKIARTIKCFCGVTCLCIDGGNLKPSVITYILQYVYKNFPNLKLAWRNHAEEIPKEINQDKLYYLIHKDVLYTKDSNNNWKLV